MIASEQKKMLAERMGKNAFIENGKCIYWLDPIETKEYCPETNGDQAWELVEKLGIETSTEGKRWVAMIYNELRVPKVGVIEDTPKEAVTLVAVAFVERGYD